LIAQRWAIRRAVLRRSVTTPERVQIGKPGSEINCGYMAIIVFVEAAFKAERGEDLSVGV
jgi:hypothetical protein